MEIPTSQVLLRSDKVYLEIVKIQKDLEEQQVKLIIANIITEAVI